MAIMLFWVKLFSQLEVLTGLSLNKFVDYVVDQCVTNLWLKLIKLVFEFLVINLMYLNFQFSTGGQRPIRFGSGLARLGAKSVQIWF